MESGDKLLNSKRNVPFLSKSKCNYTNTKIQFRDKEKYIEDK